MFLSPLFWLGALALTVPVFIHLVHKERTRRIPFSSLMFVPSIPIKELRRHKLQHIFLLCLRCVGILLLAASFARPVVQGNWMGSLGSSGGRSVLILLDNSFSMGRPQVWSRAREQVLQSVESLGPADEGMLVLFSEVPEAKTRWESSTEVLRSALESVTTASFRSTSYLEAMRSAAEYFRDSSKDSREIVLVTDLQRTGLAAGAGWKLPAGIQFELRDVGEEDSNWSVGTARIDREVYAKQYPRPIVVLLSVSPPGRQQAEVQLLLEDQLVNRQTVELDEKGIGQVSFDAFDLAEGLNRGKIVVQPEDDLEADNTFHFVLERQQPRSILVVSSGDSLYLETALSSVKAGPFVAQRSESIPPAGLTPETTPLVILDNPARMPDPRTLASYIENGGGLVVVLGSDIQPTTWSSGWQELLPAIPTEREYVRSERRPFTSMTEVQWNHPIFEVFQDRHRSAVSGAQFYAYWQLQLSPEAVVLARFQEGAPAILEKRLGKGRILVLSSSFDASWSDLPLRSAYVPFWYQSVLYVSGWERQPAELRVGEILAAPSQQAATEARTVLDPRGVRVSGLMEDSPEAVRLTQPGYYEIRSGKETDWVAVNIPSSESDVRKAPVEDFLSLYIPGTAQPSVVGSADEISVRPRESRELWWPLLVAAFCILMLESLVASRRRAQNAMP